jgi:presenilin-like A22 family membrane protease
MIVLITTIAAMLGSGLSPITVIIVLVAASIYDAWAVWKAKTMQKMAISFLKRSVIPGIAIAKKNAEHLKIEKRFGILGGGDLFFLVLVPLSFYKTDVLMTYATMAGLFGGLVFLFFFAKKKAFYPALPFMFVGMFVGAALRMLW